MKIRAEVVCVWREDYHLLEKFFCDCRAKPAKRDCKEHHVNGERVNGLYKIHKNINGRTIQVYCDQTTDGGGWTVIQRRMDGSQNFYMNWTEFKIGFGQLHREHWLGNENIYLLTAQAFFKGSEVRFDIKHKGAASRSYAKYSSFDVNNEASGYHLFVSGYSGTAGDSFSYYDGAKFTTYDRDNDQYAPDNCAKICLGGMWYKACSSTKLNSLYDSVEKYGSYFAWVGRLTFSEMKVRRK